MSRIVIEKNKVIIDGHAEDIETCNTLTNLCDELNKSKKFSTVKYEDGYGEFESVGEAEEKKFAPDAQIQIYSNDGSELLATISLTSSDLVSVTETGIAINSSMDYGYHYTGDKNFSGMAKTANSEVADYPIGSSISFENTYFNLYIVESSTSLTQLFTDIADSIRAKTNTTDTIKALDFPGKITAIPTSSTPDDVEESDVNFYDYDGTLLYAWTLAETANKTELPPLPSHDGLICQGWNWTLDEIKALGRECVVGANYITDDGKTRLYIKVTDELASDVSLVFGQSADQGVTVDWGDGSEPTAYSSSNNMVRQTHQYAPGDYVITLDPTDGVGLFLGRNGSGENLLGAYTIQNHSHCAVLRKVEIGRNFTTIGIGSYTFYNCALLETITVPLTAAKVGGEAFNGCVSLKAYVVPRRDISALGISSFYGCVSMRAVALPAAITSVPSYTFRNCRSLRGVMLPDNVASIGSYSFCNLVALRKLTIPDAVTSIGANALDSAQNMTELTIGSGVTSIPESFVLYCYGLTQLAFPGNITSIGASAFTNDYSMRLYDFTHCTAVPTLANANAFTGINAACQIKVPASLVDEWKAATNWATYADKIVGVDA